MCCSWGDRLDFAGHSTDGQNESHFDYEMLNFDRFIEANANWSQHIISNDANDYMLQTMACEHESCLIECVDTLSCALSQIQINNNETFDVLLSCSAAFSCLSSTIIADATSADLRMAIICSGDDSCNEMSVNVSVDFESFQLFCVGDGSCQELTLNLQLDADTAANRSDDGVVHCVAAEVCNDLVIRTNSEQTQLVMFEFSKDVVLDNGVGFLSAIHNIECATNKWIQFDGLLENAQTVAQSMASEYGADQYPCDGVSVHCGNRSCAMSYAFAGEGLVDQLNDDDTAYWLNLNALLKVTCNGGCEESPTLAPTVVPTKYPSSDPTDDPAKPTSDPTSDPTASPSEMPTKAPTDNPTATPSDGPSADPTRSPTTKDLYDSYFEAEFKVQGFTNSDILFIASSVGVAADSMAFAIESGYDNDGILTFRQVWVIISRLNGQTVQRLKVNPDAATLLAGTAMAITASIRCSEVNCHYLVDEDSDFEQDTFEKFVSVAMSAYFQYQVERAAETNVDTEGELLFSVESLSAVQSLQPLAETNFLFYGLVSLCGALVLLGAMALCFNELKCRGIGPCFMVDNGRWTAVLVVSLQIWDAGSDMLLCGEIWRRDDVFRRTVLLVVAVGCSLFIVLPYCANLVCAARIKALGGVIRRNEAANTWFEHRYRVFAAFVVLTGGCHPSLELVSSNIFGHFAFSSGLTRYELKQLVSIKVITSVVLENVPQLILQIMYAVSIGDVTNNAAFAFIASALSVIATLLSFCIDRRSAGEDAMQPVQYYLAIQCTRTAATSDDMDGLDALETAAIDVDAVNDHELTSSERSSILKNRGRRLALSRSLSALWETLPKCVEIGSTVLGKTSARVHVVHYVDAGNADRVERCYASSEMQRRVRRIMTNHFELGQQFDVQYITFGPDFGRGRLAMPSSPFSFSSASLELELDNDEEVPTRERMALMIEQYMDEQPDTLAANELKRFLLETVDRRITGQVKRLSRDQMVVGAVAEDDVLTPFSSASKLAMGRVVPEEPSHGQETVKAAQSDGDVGAWVELASASGSPRAPDLY